VSNANLFLTDQRIRVEFKNPWNIIANFNSSRDPRVAISQPESLFLQWRSLLDEIRTYFEKNPTS